MSEHTLAKVIEEYVKAERKACARAALLAELPAHYQWGHDAMEQFRFGKIRAAEAILARAGVGK